VKLQAGSETRISGLASSTTTRPFELAEPFEVKRITPPQTFDHLACQRVSAHIRRIAQGLGENS
jgi:hypothetical protein